MSQGMSVYSFLLVCIREQVCVNEHAKWTSVARREYIPRHLTEKKIQFSTFLLFSYSPFIWAIDPGAEISQCIRGKLRHSRRCRMVGGRRRLRGNNKQMPTGRNTAGRKGKLMKRTAFFTGPVRRTYFHGAVSMKADESFRACVSKSIPIWLTSTHPFTLSRRSPRVFLSFSVSSISPMPKLFHGHSQRGRLVTQHLPLLSPFLVLILSSFSTFWGNGAHWWDRNVCGGRGRYYSEKRMCMREWKERWGCEL